MTDNEIFKALKESKYKVNGVVTRGFYLDPELFNQVVDLINRQKEENEELQRKISELEIELKAMRGAANSYKAEVERLKNRKAVIRKDLKCDSVDDILNGTFSIESENYVVCDVEEIKSEARKEFAEKIRQKVYRLLLCAGSVDYSEFDNLLKRMESEKDEQ
jgi:SepF-like predicted cell division protein (DUF552 family)